MIGIPRFPEYRFITVDDKDEVEKYLFKTRQEISEASFSNFFVWRKSYPLGLSLIDSALLVRTFFPDGRQVCLVPIGSSEPASQIQMICHEFKKNIENPIFQNLKGEKVLPELYFAPKHYGKPDQNQEDLAEKLKSMGFDVQPDRDNWDYVYLTKDLIELEGTKYHSKKKALNKCLSNYQCTFEPMTAMIIPECVKFTEEWCKQMHCGDDVSLIQENEAVDEALEHFSKIGFMGGVVRINGKIEALTIGERLNDNTAVVHFEKANLAIDGLYQVINNWFCKEMLKDYEFVNREQDLGKPGIRKAKMSYRPHHMVEKFTAKNLN